MISKGDFIFQNFLLFVYFVLTNMAIAAGTKRIIAAIEKSKSGGSK